MGLFLLQFWHELVKLFARRRTYLGFGAFLFMETAVVVGLTRPRPQASFRHMIERNGFAFEHYFSGLAAGTLYRGVGGLFAFSLSPRIFVLYETAPGLARYLGALPLLPLALLTFASIGFFFSCLNTKPAAATIMTPSLLFFESIFRQIPYFEPYKSYFITEHMSIWLQIFQARIPWRNMGVDAAYLLALDATFVVLGVVAFRERDFKS